MAKKLNLLILGTFVLLGIYFVRVRVPADTADTYWHLSVGREVWQSQAIPQKDNFVYGPTDTHYTSTEWLSGLIFYATVKYLGFGGLLLLRALIGLTALTILYLTIRLITDNPWLKASAVSLVGFVLAIRLHDRPEMFSFIFFALINYVCYFFYLTKRISKVAYLLPMVFLIWPNIHASVAFGFFILSFWILIFALRRDSIKTVAFGQMLALFLISAIVCLFQLKPFLFFLNIKKFTTFSVNEWSSLKDRILFSGGYDFFRQVPVEAYLFLAILALYVLVFLLILRRGKVSLGYHLISLYYFLILISPFKYQRLIPLAMLLAVPQMILLAKATSGAVLPNRLVKIFWLLIIFLIVISIFAKNIVGAKIYQKVTVDKAGRTLGVRDRLWLDSFPESAPPLINQYLASKRIFTQDWWSSYLIWQVPTAKVFSDVMYAYRTQEDFANEQKLGSGVDNWQELLERYQIDTVVNTQYGSIKNNNTPVYNLTNWQLIYLDNNLLLYARDNVIKKKPVELSAIHAELPTPLKFKPEDEGVAISQLENLLKFDYKNGFARAQLTQYYLTRDLTAAKDLAGESRNLLPNDPIFPVYLAAVYANLGNCKVAEEYAHEAKIKSFGDYNFLYLVNKALQDCRNF